MKLRVNSGLLKKQASSRGEREQWLSYGYCSLSSVLPKTSGQLIVSCRAPAGQGKWRRCC
jgi:hypothetical protein